jgi:hypothetical protein
VLKSVVTTTAELYESLISILVTNHGQLIADFNVIVLDKELTIIASSTPSWIATINVKFVGTICEI